MVRESLPHLLIVSITRVTGDGEVVKQIYAVILVFAIKPAFEQGLSVVIVPKQTKNERHQ